MAEWQRENQVSFGTAVDESFHDRFKDLCHRHRLRMREMLMAMTNFFERYSVEHPEFDPRDYSQRRRPRPKV